MNDPVHPVVSHHRTPGLVAITNGADHCALLDDLTTRAQSVMARGCVLKHDGTTTVAVVSDDSRSWVVKRYNTKNRWHAIRRLMRTSRALNCWHAADWLTRAGVDTARRVAVLEERPLRFLRGRSYFVSEHVDGGTLADELGQRQEYDERLIDQAAWMVVRLRQAGIVHGDLKATNFLVGHDRLYLVDLDAARRQAPGRRGAAGLQKDLERFLRNWSAHPALRQAFEERLARAGVTVPGPATQP